MGISAGTPVLRNKLHLSVVQLCLPLLLVTLDLLQNILDPLQNIEQSLHIYCAIKTILWKSPRPMGEFRLADECSRP